MGISMHAHAFSHVPVPRSWSRSPRGLSRGAQETKTPVYWSPLKRSWLWVGPAMLLVVGAFDLALTVSAFEAGQLVEMNPIAARILEHGGSPALAVYRFVMTVTGCILLRWGLTMYRMRRYVGPNVKRVRKLVWASQLVLIASHLTLVGWWLAWLNV
jgi:hypothetical protein